MCTAIKPLSYTCVSIVLKTHDTCIPWACAYVFQDVEKALMSDLADLVAWGEFWEQFRMCSHRKSERGVIKEYKQQKERGSMGQSTTTRLAGMSCHSYDLSTHPSSPFPPSLQATAPPDLPSPPPFSFSVLTTAPTSREKRLTCIQQHLSGRKKWIKERRRPVDSQCLHCQEPKSLSANARDCPRCRRSTKKEQKRNKYPPEICHHMEKACFQKSQGKSCGAPLQWKKIFFWYSSHSIVCAQFS